MAWRGYSFLELLRRKAKMKDCSYLEYDPKTGQEDMDPKLYQQAIDEYLKDVKENPDAFKDILKYDGIVMK